MTQEEESAGLERCPRHRWLGRRVDFTDIMTNQFDAISSVAPETKNLRIFRHYLKRGHQDGTSSSFE